jgi:putative salt-induced outer membrane protein YdiY
MKNAVIPHGIGVRDGDRLILFRLDPDGPVQLDRPKTINLFELSYRGSLGLGGSVTAGNTDTESINASGDLTINKGWHRIILGGRANRGKAQGELTAQNAALNTRWDYFLTKRAYIPSLISWNTTSCKTSHFAVPASSGLVTISWIAGPIS